MKNNKWSTRSIDDRDMNIVLFVSRNKDNRDISNFKERRRSFTTKDNLDSKSLTDKFNEFVNKGISGELSRMYFSVNSRDEDKVYKDLLHFLIDTPDFNLCSIDSKIAGIAAANSNSKSKKWMFDFDINDEKLVNEFVSDIVAFDSEIEVSMHRTPHGYAIITSRGFDTRTLLEKWKDVDVTLKRDDFLCVNWKRAV